MNYKIAICDDNEEYLAYLSDLAGEWAGLSGCTADIMTFPSAEAFLFYYAEDKGCDILLLDIEMRAMNGIELAKRLRGENGGMQIVFITGYPDFMAQGYDVSALHYLIKPAGREKLFEVLSRAAARTGEKRAEVLIEASGGRERVFQDEIIYAEIFSHTLIIHTKDGRLEARMSIGELEKTLDRDMFARCHRSYIAGLGHILKITKTELRLKGGAVLPVSRGGYAEVNRRFIDWHKKRKGMRI